MGLSYQIEFEDKTTFTGKSLDRSWDNVPDKKIKSLTYLFGKKKFVLQGYKEYNHLIEKVSMFGRKSLITQILLIGRKKNESHLLIIDFKNKKVLREVVPIGKEYQNMIVSGWKKGIGENE